MSRKTPIGWVQKNLSSLGKLSTSSVDKKIEDGEREVCLLNYMDIYRNNFIKRRYPFMKVTASDREIDTFSVRKGDVFFTPSSETPDDIGHSGVVLEEMDEVLQSYHLMRLRPSQEDPLDLNFKGYVFRSNSVYEQFRVRATGSTRFTLSIADISEVAICFPESKKEQQKIAEILTSVDEVIENTQSKINKLEDLKKATMNELLTKGIGHTEFKETEVGKIPKSWFVKSLGDLVTRFYQGINTVADELKYQQYGYPIIQTKHMTNGYLDIHDARYVSQCDYESYASKFNPVVGDILLSNIGTVGKTYLIESEKKFLIAWNIFLIGCKETIVPKFLCIFLERLENQNFYDKLMTGNATKFVNKTTLSEIKLPIPSITEQLRIASQIRSVENSINLLKERLNAVMRLKNSLMQDLLTGKVRVTVN